MENPRKPDYYGVITTMNKKGYGERIGRASIWRQTDSNEKHPVFRGNVEINGVRFKMALWKQPEECETGNEHTATSSQ
jgi:hypothetical protein